MITCEYCGTRTHDHEQIKCLSCGGNLPVPINIINLGNLTDDVFRQIKDEIDEQNFFDPAGGGQEPPVTITTDPAFVWK